MVFVLAASNVMAQKIGDKKDGGIVYHIFQPGDPEYKAGQTGGLIAADKDLPTELNWDEAKKACEALGSGWRLPTKDELVKLYLSREECKCGPWDKGAYWSSSVGPYDSRYWRAFYKNNTSDQIHDRNKEHGVRAVRAFPDATAPKGSVVNKTTPEVFPGNSITSPNKKFELNFTFDGNIQILNKESSNPIWSVPFDKGWNNTDAARKQGSVMLQNDCNLCFYNNKNKKWCAATHDKPCKEVKLTDEGRLVLYGTSNEILWTSPLPEKAPEKSIAIGAKKDGGIVYYILKPGETGYDASKPHGLIAAENDILSKDGYRGKSSWADAKKACEALGSGWRLPTKDELVKLYDAWVYSALLKDKLSLRIEFYWSSKEWENDANYVWLLTFYDGHKDFDAKTSINYVRAVRAF